jgi:hypothetical protein
MKTREFEISQSPWPTKESLFFLDFKIGNIILSKHLNTSHIGVLSVNRRYANYLLGLEISQFTSDRAPLYVCSCCHDLDCGAITAHIRFSDELVVWSDFGYQGVGRSDYSQSGFLANTGPYAFSLEQYRLTLTPYTKSF